MNYSFFFTFRNVILDVIFAHFKNCLNDLPSNTCSFKKKFAILIIINN